MRKNMGTVDRLGRGILAAGAFAGAGVVGFTTGWGVVLLVVTAVMAATAASGYCPLYDLVHVDTIAKRSTKGNTTSNGHSLRNAA